MITNEELLADTVELNDLHDAVEQTRARVHAELRDGTRHDIAAARAEIDAAEQKYQRARTAFARKAAGL